MSILCHIWKIVQVILFEIDCAIFYTNLHELFLSVHKLNKLVNSGKFMDNCWISCQVMANMKKVYDDLIIINLYSLHLLIFRRNSKKLVKMQIGIGYIQSWCILASPCGAKSQQTMRSSPRIEEPASTLFLRPSLQRQSVGLNWCCLAQCCLLWN